MKLQLRNLIEDFIDGAQDNEDRLDMWISNTLIDAMTDAAWNVLQESRNTQEWLKREGHMEAVTATAQGGGR